MSKNTKNTKSKSAATKYARKAKKRYTLVDFETEIFEGTFTFPSPKHLPLGVLKAFDTGDVGKLITWLEEAGVDKDAIEAFESLEGEELQDFMAAWQDGELSVPKSSK